MNYLVNLKEFRNNLFKKENIFYFLFIIIIFFLDRLSKLQIINKFNEVSHYVNNYINFDLIWNIGIGFGFLSSTSSLMYNLITIIIAIVILILFYIFLDSENLDKFIYSIIIGGALGNFYDRVIYKAVPDFIDIHFNNFHWFTFNVADIFISIGIIFFIIKGIMTKT